MDNHNASIQQQILDSNNRQRIIAWLAWNDSNGVYSDADCKLEGWRPLSLKEAKQLMRQILAQ